MGNRAGIGMLGASPTFDVSVAPQGTSSALGTCQEPSCLSERWQWSQLCIHAGVCPVLCGAWENSRSPLWFADSFQGFYFTSCAESWFTHCPPPLPVIALGELTMDYIGWGISVPHVRQNKIQFSNTRHCQCPPVKCWMWKVLERSWCKDKPFFLKKNPSPDWVVALKALICPGNLFSPD